MNIKTITMLPLAVILGLTTALAVMLLTQSSAYAHDGHDHKTEQKKEDKKEEVKDTKENKGAVYSYTVQVGDSYSKLARKAIQTYGIKNKVDLSQSRIIFAETKLTQEAGSPSVNVGEQIEIKESTVKSWVEKAKDLSKENASKWEKYTVNVNFNTNKVGEARN